MKQTLRVPGSDKVVTVVLTQTDGVWQVDVDGESFQLTVAVDDDGLRLSTEDGRNHTVQAHAQAPNELLVDGCRYVLEDATHRRARAETSKTAGLMAPMPGTVLDVRVADGEAVTKGQTLVVMEAMKMEHAIKAPCDGTVQRVLFDVGARVCAGDPLVEME